MLNGRCDQARLITGLRDLLGCYFQPAETPEMRARNLALFVQDLADMSDDVVAWALTEWRRTMDRRPTPAALRQLCMTRRYEAVQALTKRRPREEAGPTFQLSEEERAARREQVDRIMREAGFRK